MRTVEVRVEGTFTPHAFTFTTRRDTYMYVAGVYKELSPISMVSLPNSVHRTGPKGITA